MALADDFAALRKSGRSDAEILSSYQQFDPDKSHDIQTLLDQGRSPSDVLNTLSAFDAQNQPGMLGTAKNALAAGAADELSGISNSIKTASGPGQSTDFLDRVATAIRPEGYQSASQGLGDTSKGALDRAGYIPRALVEGAPGAATDLSAAGIGGEVGGALGTAVMPGPGTAAGAFIGAGIGGIGSYLARNFGNDAKARAVAATGDPNATPTSSDMLRAAGTDAVLGGLNTFGLKAGVGGGVIKAGESLAPAIAAKMAKGAAVDATTGVAQDAIHQAGIDGQNPLNDPTGLALSGVSGAAAGAGLRALGSVSDVNNRLKFSDIDPVYGEHLANLYNDKDFSDPYKAWKAVTDVDGQLDYLAKEGQKAVNPQLQALQQANGFKDDTGLLLGGVRQDLNSGNVVNQDRLQTLQDRLGNFSEGQHLLDVLNLQNAQNQVKSAGNFQPGTADNPGKFGGGLSDSWLGQVVNPEGKVGKWLLRGEGVEAMASMLDNAVHGFSAEPTTALAMAGGQYALRSGMKGIDSLLGNANPLGEFVPRFSNPMAEASGASSKPSFRQTMVDQKAAEAERAAQAKADAKTEAVANKTAQSAADLATKALNSQYRADRAEAEGINNTANKAGNDVAKLAQQAVVRQQAMATREASRQQVAEAKAAEVAQRYEHQRSLNEAKNAAKVEAAQTRADAVLKAAEAKAQAVKARQESAQQRADTTVARHEHLRELAGIKADAKVKAAQARADATLAKAQRQSGKTRSTPNGGPKDNIGVVEHAGKQVFYDKSKVRNEAGYRASITKRMADREDVFSEAKKAVPEARDTLEAMHTALNHNNVSDMNVADGIISDMANEHPPEIAGRILDAINKPKLWASFVR